MFDIFPNKKLDEIVGVRYGDGSCLCEGESLGAAQGLQAGQGLV